MHRFSNFAAIAETRISKLGLGADPGGGVLYCGQAKVGLMSACNRQGGGQVNLYLQRRR